MVFNGFEKISYNYNPIHTYKQIIKKGQLYVYEETEQPILCLVKCIDIELCEYFEETIHKYGYLFHFRIEKDLLKESLMSSIIETTFRVFLPSKIAKWKLGNWELHDCNKSFL